MVVFSPRIDGAGFGLGIMCYSNAVRRLRMFRRARTPRPTAKWGAQKNGIVCGKMSAGSSSLGGTRRDSGGRRGKGGGRSLGPPVPRRCTWQGLQTSSGVRDPSRAASLTFAAHRAQDRGSTRARC